MPPKELKGRFEKRASKYSKRLEEEIKESLSTIFDESFKRVADEHNIENIDSEEISLWVYKNGRCRAHFGTAITEEIFVNQFDLTPLLDPDLRKLKLYTETCCDKNLLMALIYVRYCPKLLDFPFEGGRLINEETIEYANRINEKKVFITCELAIEEFELVTHDSSLSENENDRVKVGFPGEYLRNVFSSERCKRIFCSHFDKELYKIAEKNLIRESYHPLRECFPVIATAKYLMDVQVSEEIDRKQAYDDTRYLLLNTLALPKYSDNENSYLYELKEKLNDYDRIVIYGAGLYGGLLLEKIYDWHLYKEVDFAVSDTVKAKKHMGHDLYDISNIQTAQDNYIVIIAVGKRLEEELANNLKRLNISSYIKLSDEIREALMSIGGMNER